MPAQNEKKDHLPVLGVGPAYVIAITVLTVVCITLSKLGILPYLRIRATVGVMHAVGTAFLIVGIWLWVSAAIKEKLREKIIANQLVTTGVCLCTGQKPYLLRICVCHVGSSFAFK